MAPWLETSASTPSVYQASPSCRSGEHISQRRVVFLCLCLLMPTETIRWQSWNTIRFVQAELQNGRWAMMGVAGILFTSVSYLMLRNVPT